MSVIAIGLLLCCSSSGAAAFMMGGSKGPLLPMGPAPPPPPEDCEYIEKDTYDTCTPIYSTLSPDDPLNSSTPKCGGNAGIQYKEIEVTKQPKYGGKECPVRGEKRNCNIECKDCEGQFQPDKTGQAGSGYKKYRWLTTKYVVTSPPAPDGKPCPYKDGQKISIIKTRRYRLGERPHDYNDAAKCARFIGKGGSAPQSKVYGRGYISNSKLRKFNNNVKWYYKESEDRNLWCAVHK